MNLNILHPKQAVDAAFEKPSIAAALALVLAAAIVWIAQVFVVTGALDLQGAALGIAGSYIRFLVLAAVLFALGVVLNRNSAKGRFAGTLSALSLIQLLWIAAYVLSIIAFFLIAPQVSGLPEGGESGLLAGMQAYSAVSESQGSINFALVGAFLAAAFAIMVYGLYIAYLTARRLAGTGFLGALLLAVVATAIAGMV